MNIREDNEKNYKDILKSIRQIEIKTSHIVNNFFAGEYHSIFKGRGMEFDEVREYDHSDDIRNMDWKVSARYRKPFVKHFREERELTLFVIADISASNVYSSVETLKEDIVVNLTATFAFSAIKNNDKVALILFTDGIEKFVPPRKGRNHILRIIREVIEHKPHSKQTDLANAMLYFNKIQKRHSILILITDYFSDIPRQEMEIAAKRHDVIACIVGDRREKHLEDMGIISTYDPESGEVMYIDTSNEALRNEYNNKMEQAISDKMSLLRRYGIDVIELSTDEDYTKTLIHFFKKRSRKH